MGFVQLFHAEDGSQIYTYTVPAIEIDQTSFMSFIPISDLKKAGRVYMSIA